MKDLFRKAGRVTHTDIDTEPDSRRSKGTGLVIYEDPRDVKAAISKWEEFFLSQDDPCMPVIAIKRTRKVDN